MSGNTKDVCTDGIPLISAGPSIMEPCIGGISAPPTIAITKPADARLASSPIPLSAMPYMVGNINDIHAEVAIKQYNPVYPPTKIVPSDKTKPPIANSINSCPGLKKPKRNVHIKRLAKNIPMATML